MTMLFAAVLALTQQWLLVSDLHVNPFDRSTAPSTYHSDSNWPLFDRTVAAMRARDGSAPVVIIAGDFLAHQWAAKAKAAGQDPALAAERTVGRIAESFGRAFPHAQFVITLGNNDDPCGDYRTGPDSPYLAALAKIWAPLVNRNRAAPSFRRDFAYAGYYTARLPGRLRAIVLDDVYWSMFFRGCGRGGNIAGQQLAWLRQNLRSDTPAAIVMHIPPGVDPSGTLIAHRFIVVPYWNPAYYDAFLREVDGRNVRFAIAGHLHRLDYRITAGVPVLIAPSISPIYGNNPAFLTLAIDGSSISDYAEYTYDGASQHWPLTFHFRDGFGASSFSTAQLLAVHDRIFRDVRLRDRWAQASVAGSDEWYSIAASWRAFWCAQTQAGSAYTACAGDERRAAVLPLLVAAAVAVVAVALVWYSRRRLWKRRDKNG
jgi:predicted phosphodiesterase